MAGIVALLTAMVIPAVSRVRAASRTTVCLGQLRTITTAFRGFAQDNGGVCPNPSESLVPWERSLMRYAPPSAFVCPTDEELAPLTQSSYDWRDTPVEEATLAGRPLAGARGDAVLVFDALPSWHTRGYMNVARVDGSADTLKTDQCVDDLGRPVRGSGAP